MSFLRRETISQEDLCEDAGIGLVPEYKIVV